MKQRHLLASALGLALVLAHRGLRARDSGLGTADALLGRHADAAAAQAYKELGPLPDKKREGWRQNNWGLALLRQNRPAAAVEHFRKAVEADRDNFIARANLGAAWEQVGDLTKALAVYRRAVQLVRTQNRALKAGRVAPEAAQEAVESLAPVPTDSPVARPAGTACVLGSAGVKVALTHANALLHDGRYAEAVQAYAAIGRLASPAKESWRLNNGGLCLLRLAHPRDACAWLEAAVAVLPANAVAWNNLSMAYEQLGLEDKAAAAWARGSAKGAFGADVQRLQLARVKVDFSVERRRWEALRR